MEMPIWALVSAILGPSGAAFVGVKVAFNGMKEDLAEIKSDLKELRIGQGANRERIISVETTLKRME